MGGLRARKNALIAALKARAIAHHLTPEQVDTFERMYRIARTHTEQDEVSRALDFQVNGWKTGTDAFSRVLQAASDLDEFRDPDEEDPPGLKAALLRSQIKIRPV
jgi:hypothetical protein